MSQKHTIAVRSLSDVEYARHQARLLATGAGFNRERVEMVVLAVSELGMNLLRYAESGSVVLSRTNSDGRSGVQVESHDRGPGIADLNLAMQDDYSTGGGLGSGLPAVKRLMDEFEITSGPEGTTVTARKWMTLPGH